ncbi:MAG: DUF4908 domain-containing protein [Caulobacteraceae bacterium]
MAAPETGLRVVLACAAALSAGGTAASAAPYSWREALSGRLADHAAAPITAKYETDAGAIFVFDRSTPRPLLKFEDDPEIWVLQPAKGPRGDIIYRNDLGEEMLRSTSLGGMTVFTEKRPEGSPAALDGSSSPLRVAALSPANLFSRFYQASVRASRAAQHQVGFETREDAEPASAAYLADAAVVASEALVDMAARPDGKAELARVADVVIAQGKKPGATLQKGVLTVTIVPKEGVFGRPSSRRIERAAGAR